MVRLAWKAYLKERITSAQCVRESYSKGYKQLGPLSSPLRSIKIELSA